MRRLGLAPSSRTSRPKATQVLVVDDHVSFAEALACRLDTETGMHAFAATTIEQAEWVLAQREVDVVLLNVELGGSIAFSRHALSTHPDLHIVVVAASEGEDYVVEAVRAGVSAWVSKNESVDHLLSAVSGTLRGETWIPPRLLTSVIAELKSAQRDRVEHGQLLDALTRREKEVLRCLASGLTRDEIADQLYLSRNTVRTHIQSCLKKLNVHSTLAAVALARRNWAGQSSASSEAIKTAEPRTQPPFRAPSSA